jgi:hypothetical protein
MTDPATERTRLAPGASRSSLTLDFGRSVDIYRQPSRFFAVLIVTLSITCLIITTVQIQAASIYSILKAVHMRAADMRLEMGTASQMAVSC